MHRRFFPRLLRCLPVLKEAGVVDSGGQGLLEVLHGAYDAFLGKEIDYSAIEATAGTTMVKPGAAGRDRYQIWILYRVYHYA